MRRTLMVLQGVPDFVAALVLVLVFSVWLELLPSLGASGFDSWILPVAALALPIVSTLTRLLRSQLLELLGEDFVLAARSKGISEVDVVLRHALRNALPALVTYLALQIGWLIGGTVLVEIVFGIPGIGQLAVNSTANRDITVIQAIVVVVAVGYVLLNLAADLLVAALDPRVRATYT